MSGIKKYILYGAGYVGMQALEYYGTGAVQCFVDSKHYGTEFKGIPVIDPNEIESVLDEHEVIVCSENPKTIGEIISFLNGKNIQYSVFRKYDDVCNYTFIDRQRGLKKLLIVLAGYKEYLWEIVFMRVSCFSNDSFDICILSAGKHSDELEEISNEKGWSYLSTRENRVGMIQNLAIDLHPNAEMIFKMDEDIFLTKNTLFEMEQVFRYSVNEGKYAVGFVAPLININGYGYRRILEITDSVDEYRRRFGTPIYGQGGIFSNIDICRFMWDVTSPIDDFSETITKNKTEYSICFHRFSIGCIMFSREIWEKMNRIKDAPEGQLGIDEIAICNWCMEKQYAIIVAERAYAGHFSFAPQNELMRDYYKKNNSLFSIKEHR